MAAAMISTFGSGITDGDVCLTPGELRSVRSLYGFESEAPMAKPPPPRPPPIRGGYLDEIQYKQAVEKHAAWVDPRNFMQAGADRNAMRHAVADGLRMLAWIAKFVPAGDDPMKTLIQFAIDAGCDIEPSDAAWAEGSGEDEEEDA